MFVSIAMYSLRKREGKDLPVPAFKVPFFPVLPVITFLLVLLVFWGLSFEAKLYTLIWFLVGIVIYVFYGIKHSKRMMKMIMSYQKIKIMNSLIFLISSLEIFNCFKEYTEKSKKRHSLNVFLAL